MTPEAYTTHASTRWLTPQEVGVMVGFSAGFIYGEIRAGELKATYVLSQSKDRQRGRWRIALPDADAYYQRLHGHHATADSAQSARTT